MKTALLVAIALGVVSCGSSGGSQTNLVQTTYSYAANQQITVVPGTCTLVVGPVTVNGDGTMFYDVEDLTGTDVLNVVILPDTFYQTENCAFLQGQTLVDVSFTGSASDHVSVIADTYDLLATCGNPAGNSCVFDLTWNATY